MNNRILSCRETGSLACAWFATGDPRNPLARRWSEAAAAPHIHTPTCTSGGSPKAGWTR